MITVVSGLPRSGTSMMMQMLAAGGIQAEKTRIMALFARSQFQFA